MEISLIRHGRSKQVENHRLTSREFQHWIAAYDESSIFAERNYPETALEKASVILHLKKGGIKCLRSWEFILLFC